MRSSAYESHGAVVRGPEAIPILGDGLATGGEAGGFVWGEAARYGCRSEVAADLGMRGDGGGVQSTQAAQSSAHADPEECLRAQTPALVDVGWHPFRFAQGRI
ncbi:hypothetical protein JAO29_10500 [Edaphobacter sp. HDX4]|uniref:hypothetical protein n=1 Tax=Edaphobacter sp. HDX4 TaxID=2794064 RepID=UPI002FE6180B